MLVVFCYQGAVFLVIILSQAVSEEVDDIMDLLGCGRAATGPLLESVYVGVEYRNLSECSYCIVGGVLILLDAMIHQLQVCHPVRSDHSQRVR